MTRRHWLVCVAVAGALFVLAAVTTPAPAASLASCYADTTDGFLGQTAANGETVTSSTVAVANKHLPFGTVLMVKVDGHAPVRARVIDRGPFIPGRVIDVTWALAKKLGYRDCAAWGVRGVRTWRAR